MPFPVKPPLTNLQVRAEVLLEHLQIELLTAKVLAKFSASPSREFSAAFWQWLPRAMQRQLCPGFPDPPLSQVRTCSGLLRIIGGKGTPTHYFTATFDRLCCLCCLCFAPEDHILDNLQVLPGLDSDDLRPLRERKRALKKSKGASEALVEALVTCGALLVSEDVPCCPSCELPDAVARALAYALREASRTSQVVTAVAARDHLIQVLRMEILEKLSQSNLPEALEVAGWGQVANRHRMKTWRNSSFMQ